MSADAEAARTDVAGADTGRSKRPKSRPLRWLRNVGIGLGIAAVYLWSFGTLEVDWGRVAVGVPQTAGILDRMFLQAEWSYLPEALGYMMESVFIAYAGSFMATFLAVPFGFLAAENLGAARWATGAGKLILSFIRTFPEILLALMFVAAFGPGAFAGVLATGLHSIGMLGKLYAEVVEGIDRGVLEGLEASGANRLQAFVYGVVPQVLPEFTSYALYRFEIDIRSTTLLGLVGAGGIGAPLLLQAQARSWETIGVIFIVIVAVVALIDVISSWVRAKLV